jgi:hypothetical protein
MLSGSPIEKFIIFSNRNCAIFLLNSSLAGNSLGYESGHIDDVLWALVGIAVPLTLSLYNNKW